MSSLNLGLMVQSNTAVWVLHSNSVLVSEDAIEILPKCKSLLISAVFGNVQDFCISVMRYLDFDLIILL